MRLNRAVPRSDTEIMEHDRRLHPRVQIQKPVKVYIPSTRQYVGGATGDVSIGGVLLELHSARPLNVGDRIDVGVAWTGAPILAGERLIPSRVVRVHARRDGVQRLALSFMERQALAAAA